MRTYLPENTLRLLANAISAHVTVRRYNNGNSEDVTFDSAPEDRAALQPIVFGSLLGLNWGDDNRNDPGRASAILNASEFILMNTLPLVNTYDTIYNPLRAVLDVWQFASDPLHARLAPVHARYIWDILPAWHDFLAGILAYAAPEDYAFLSGLDDARSLLEDWTRDGITEDIPAPDAGMLLLLWNLYVHQHKEKERD